MKDIKELKSIQSTNFNAVKAAGLDQRVWLFLRL
jgi:hypothetical protein